MMSLVCSCTIAGHREGAILAASSIATQYGNYYSE